MSEVDPILLSIEGDASGADEALGSFEEMLAGIDEAVAGVGESLASAGAIFDSFAESAASAAETAALMGESADGASAGLDALSESAGVASASLDTAAASAGEVAAANDVGAASAEANAASTDANTAAVDTNTASKDRNVASTDKLNLLLVGMGVVIVAAGIGALKAAGDFQQGMLTLYTSAGEAYDKLGMVGDGIKKISVDTGTTTDNLIGGMYMVESSGYHAKDALTVLTAAAEGAKAEGAELSVVTNAETTVMKDFGMGANQATDAMNFLTAVTQNGKTKLQDLAGSLSQVLPVASAVKIHLTDVGGAMATITGEGVPAANAATYLRQMIISLSAPAAAGKKALSDIGLTVQQVSDGMKKSLPDTLKLIQDHLAETYKVGSPEYVQALKDIAGGQKNMQGMLDLTGSHLGDFSANVKKVSGVMKDNKGEVLGWAEVQKNLNFKMDQAKEAVGLLFIDLGTKLMPIAAQFASWITSTAVPALRSFAEFLGKNHDAMALVAGVIGGVLLGAIAALAAPLAAAAVAAAPFIAVGVGIGLVAALIISHWKQVSPIFKAIGDVIGPVANAIKQSLGDAFKAAGDALKDAQPAFKDLLNALAPALPILKNIAAFIGVNLVLAIGIVIGIIRGLIGAFKGIIEIVTGVINFVHGFIDVIIGIFTGNSGKVSDGLKQMLGGLLGIWKGVFDAITGFMGGFLKGILGFFDHLTGGALSKIGNMKTGIVGVFKSLTGAIDGSTKEAQIKAGLHADAMKIHQIVTAEAQAKGVIAHLEAQKKGILQQLAETTDPAKKHALEMKLNHINAAEEMEKQSVAHMEQMKKKTLAHMQDLKDQAKHHADLMKMGVIGHIIEMKEQAVQWLQKMIPDALAKLGDLKDKALAKAGEIKDNILGKFGELKDKAVDKIKDMGKSITDEIGKLPAQLLTLGGQIIQGLIDGIKGAVSGIGNALGGVKDAVVGGVKNLFGIHSPSKLMADEVGGPLADGILQGLTKGVANIKGSTNALIKGIVPTVKVSGVGATSLGSNGGSGLGGGGTSNQVVMLLTQIVQALQKGPQTPNIGGVTTNNTSTFNVSGGGGNTTQMYRLLNQLAGIAQENAIRGATAGIGG